MRVWSNTQGKTVLSGDGNDVIHDRLYFGTIGGGASVINARDFRVFVNAVGQQTQNISTLAAVTQQESDTSLEGQGGTIPNGESFVITAIGINVGLSNIQATTPFTDNAVASINVTPIYRVSPQPLIDALVQQCTFELFRNSDERLERGNISEYPCEFGRNVAFGGAGAAVPALAGGAQNAYTVNPAHYVETAGHRFRELPVYNMLASLDQFYGVLKVNREIDLASTLLTGCIEFYLVGKLITHQERVQYVAGFAG